MTDFDGVYYDSEYIKNQLQIFLMGKPESSHIDANNNAKNSRRVNCSLFSSSR